MRIHLDRVGDEPFKWQERRHVQPSILERTEGVSLGEIAWEGNVTNTGSEHLLQGKLSYQQTLTCQRCLADTSLPVSASSAMTSPTPLVV